MESDPNEMGGIPEEVLEKWVEIWDRNNRAGRRGVLEIDAINYGEGNTCVKYWNKFHGTDEGVMEIVNSKSKAIKK
ncbi:MAG: hypothetical protein UT24_C0010G0003 [Candidatus Woesebacteria bacterium GW2011_GWB1_39_12]|uniref:Uncharacterized protein n=2 Tax=Candidatus Woeseibacteriota TaxID=1752722 RepID=A0A0G0PIH2_9BACT|nr:MAG: hypothetical protein UT23_C0007G0052 [Candidatus Woesebacteria bacterium GW2011_GWA1_39_12]KKR00630.1 MAG: hypothetical protein UT24_C0010G0003 [Candidatus Woesebacteria bacterium GW2011_GWB1_39_12]